MQAPLRTYPNLSVLTTDAALPPDLDMAGQSGPRVPVAVAHYLIDAGLA